MSVFQPTLPIGTHAAAPLVQTQAALRGMDSSWARTPQAFPQASLLPLAAAVTLNGPRWQQQHQQQRFAGFAGSPQHGPGRMRSDTILEETKKHLLHQQQQELQERKAQMQQQQAPGSAPAAPAPARPGITAPNTLQYVPHARAHFQQQPAASLHRPAYPHVSRPFQEQSQQQSGYGYRQEQSQQQNGFIGNGYRQDGYEQDRYQQLALQHSSASHASYRADRGQQGFCSQPNGYSQDRGGGGFIYNQQGTAGGYSQQDPNQQQHALPRAQTDPHSAASYASYRADGSEGFASNGNYSNGNHSNGNYSNGNYSNGNYSASAGLPQSWAPQAPLPAPGNQAYPQPYQHSGSQMQRQALGHGDAYGSTTQPSAQPHLTGHWAPPHFGAHGTWQR